MVPHRLLHCGRSCQFSSSLSDTKIPNWTLLASCLPLAAFVHTSPICLECFFTLLHLVKISGRSPDLSALSCMVSFLESLHSLNFFAPVKFSA